MYRGKAKVYPWGNYFQIISPKVGGPSRVDETQIHHQRHAFNDQSFDRYKEGTNSNTTFRSVNGLGLFWITTFS